MKRICKMDGLVQDLRRRREELEEETTVRELVRGVQCLDLEFEQGN